jgi:hypothetical protein
MARTVATFALLPEPTANTAFIIVSHPASVLIELIMKHTSVVMHHKRGSCSNFVAVNLPIAPDKKR